MKQKDENRTKWLNLRLTEAEYLDIQKRTEQTTCNSMSDYGRKMIMGKPLIMRYRNQSLDDFVNQMAQVRDALDKIGNNFDQAVRRLHAFRQVPEIQQWILLNEQDKIHILRQIETISNKITQAYQLWSRE